MERAARRLASLTHELATLRRRNEELELQVLRRTAMRSPPPLQPPTPSSWDERVRGPMPKQFVGLDQCEVEKWLHFFELWYG